MIVIVQCTMTLKALLLFGALALTVYLFTVAEKCWSTARHKLPQYVWVQNQSRTLPKHLKV